MLADAIIKAGWREAPPRPEANEDGVEVEAEGFLRRLAGYLREGTELSFCLDPVQAEKAAYMIEQRLALEDEATARMARLAGGIDLT